MSSERNAFVFYKSFYEAILEIPNDHQLELFHMVCQYCFNGKHIQPSHQYLNGIFKLIKAQIDASNSRYEHAVSSGKKGGRPAKQKNELPKSEQDDHINTFAKSEQNVEIENEKTLRFSENNLKDTEKETLRFLDNNLKDIQEETLSLENENLKYKYKYKDKDKDKYKEKEKYNTTTTPHESVNTTPNQPVVSSSIENFSFNNSNLDKRVSQPEYISEEETQRRAKEQLEKLQQYLTTRTTNPPKPKQPDPPKLPITVDTENMEFVNISDKDMELWRATYPNIDVPQALKQAAVYAVEKGIEKKNWRMYIVNWLINEHTKYNKVVYMHDVQKQKEEEARQRFLAGGN